MTEPPDDDQARPAPGPSPGGARRRPATASGAFAATMHGTPDPGSGGSTDQIPTLREDEAPPPGPAPTGALPDLGPRYQLRACLGHGGMGTVYAAHDLDLDELVAIKLLRADLTDGAEAQARLRHEVRLARRVSHPNVCRVHDLGQHGGRVFITMELVPGQSLRTHLAEVRAGQRPPFALARVVDLLTQLGAGLAAAHRAGVIHRDVKPDNVMLSDQRVVITDFGIATPAGTARELIGTPGYLAPETVTGQAFDHRADVYALAVLAYELLAGRPPFAVRSTADALTVAQGRRAYPPLPTALATAVVREELDAVLARALAIDPAARTPSVEAMTRGLAMALAGAGQLERALTSGERGEAAVTTPTTLRHGEARRIAIVRVHGEPLDERALTLVAEAGGTVVRTDPTSLVALFGAPVSFGDDVERAARTLSRLVAASPTVRAGLDAQRVIVREGRADWSEAELEAALAGAPIGAIVATAAAAHQLAGRFDLTGAGAAFQVGPARRAPVPVERFFRQRELAAALDAIEDGLRARRPTVVELHGAAGAGKSQLRDALVAELGHRRQLDWLSAEASPMAESAPLATLRDAHPEWFAAAMATAGDRTAILAAARAWLVRRAAANPTVLVIDNWQWADEMTRAVIASLADTDGVAVAVLALVRTEAGRVTPIERRAVVVELAPLARAEAARLVAAHCPDATASAITSVVDRAEGNPLFLEELARALAAGGSATTSLPASVESALAARLDHLPRDVARLARLAGLVGHRFGRDEVAVIYAEPTALSEALFALQDAAVIGPAGGEAGRDRYAFTPAVFAEVARARLVDADRIPLQRQLAAWYQGRAQRGGPLDTVAMLAAAHHHLGAGDAAAAAEAYRLVGVRNLELFAYREARDALTRAVELAAGADAELLDRACEATLAVDGAAAAAGLASRALAACGDDPALRARLLWRAGHVAAAAGDSAGAITHYQDGLALAAPDDRLAPWAERDPRTAALLYGSLGWTVGYQQGSQRGHAWCERAVALLGPTVHRRDLAQALSRLGATYMRASKFRDQLSCNQRNLAIAVELRDLSMQLTAHINLGVVYGVLGDNPRALEHTRQAYLLARRMNADATTGLVANNLAGYLLETAAWPDARAFLDEALATLTRTGKRYVLVETLVFEARYHALAGDQVAALGAAERALGLARELGHVLDAGIARRILAQLRALAAPTDPAIAAELRVVLAELGPLDPFETARTHAALARVLREAGHDVDAATHRSHARAFFLGHDNARELAQLDERGVVR
ncbi:MAG: protein kinase [Kofleriaceae bacterium]|nr:protein kinase [Kofleriaceae bacterium]